MEFWFPLVLAPAIGSFLACAAVRLPVGQSLWGRSACPACGHVLGPCELVPVLSWLAQGGQCRVCGATIPACYPIIELLAVLVAISAMVPPEGWRMAAGLGLGWTLLLLAAIDWRCQILPDTLTLPLIAVGLLLALIFEPDDFPARVIAAAAGWSVFAGLGLGYRRLRGRDGLGGGDGKLAAVAGSWIGPLGLPWVVLAAALGGLAWVGLARLAGQSWSAERRLPFGPFLAAAIWGVWLVGRP